MFEWAAPSPGEWDDPWAFRRLCKTCHSRFDAATLPRGETHGMAKLTESIVREARHSYNGGAVTFEELAGRYGVHESTITRAVTRQTWAHVA
jgi:hypothetical protein